MNKREDVVKLIKPGGVGVELGVAEGEFSHRVLQQNHFEHFYSIDMWAGDRGHDIEQYKRVVHRLRPHRSKNTILKMRFDEALDLFEDNSLDFVYVDGYAHTAQENGKTLDDWYKKLKPFGIFAGDDYHEHFRDNVTIIDLFKDKHSLLLNVIDCHEPNSVWSEYPTWWVRKIPAVDLKNKTVAIVGNSESLFEQRYGKDIDSHDVVIRLNRCTALFKPGEHSESHGDRTDVWSAWRVDEYETFDIARPVHTVQMAFWTGSNYKPILCYTLAEARSLISMYRGPDPSTGLMTLDWVSRRNPKQVSVYGFDWKKTPTWSDPTRSRDTLHDFERERQFCSSYFKDHLGFQFY